MVVGLSPGDFVLDGDPAPFPKRSGAPFSAHVYCGQTAAWIKMPLGTEVGLGLRDTRHCVRWGPSSPPLKGHSLQVSTNICCGQTQLPSHRGAYPQFSANVRCGETTGWTKMPLGMEVVLGPGDFVFDGDPAVLRKKAHPLHPIFGPCLLWRNGWMDQDATWYGDKPRPKRRCVRWGRSSLRKGAQPPVFGSCLLWPNG